MMFNVEFLDSDRPADQMWFQAPKVRDVVKVWMLSDDEFEYWVVRSVSEDTVQLAMM